MILDGPSDYFGKSCKILQDVVVDEGTVRKEILNDVRGPLTELAANVEVEVLVADEKGLVDIEPLVLQHSWTYGLKNLFLLHLPDMDCLRIELQLIILKVVGNR